MSEKKLAIKLSTLEGIGDAVRSKEGSTEPIPVNVLAKRIDALQIASGENKLNQYFTKTLTEVTVEDLNGKTSIESYAFDNFTQLVSVAIADSVITIGDYAFRKCPIVSLTLGNNVTSIGREAYSYCTVLPRVVIPDSVISIGNWAFDNNDSLVDLTIGRGIQSIGKGGFAKFLGQKMIVRILATTPPSINADTFQVTKINKIIVPKGCGDAYKTATNWANYADFIEEAAE